MYKNIIVAALFILGVACSTPQSRIKEKEDLFVHLEPQDQMKIQNGDIDLGYNEDMVYLAKGNPKEKTIRREGAKTITVWTYSKPTFASPAGAPPTGFQGAYGYPQLGPGSPPPQPTPMFYGGTAYRVEFENGKVRRFGNQ